MLKTDFIFIFMLILLLLVDVPVINATPPFIANTLAFFAGLCLKSFPDLIKGVLTAKDFAVRMLKVVGLCIIGYLIWIDKKIEQELFYYIFFVTLFCELIIYLFEKWGTNWLKSKAKTFDNE